MVAATAFAQTGTPILEIKTPPMRDSDVYTLPIDWHFPGTGGPAEIPGAGWAGGRIKIHVLDASEVDVDAIIPKAPGYLYRILPSGTFPGGPLPGIYTGPITGPFGPRSNNVTSAPLYITAIHPLAQQSGIDPPVSHREPLFDVVLHAKNTNLGQNSDIDLTLMFSNIWHNRGGTPGSELIHFPNSVSIWSNSNVSDDPSSWQQFHINPTTDPVFASNFRIPEGPPIDVPGHWVHIPESLVFHTFPGPGSTFFKYMLTTAWGIGIEHVPEPVSFALVGLGLVCGSMGVFSRRRRCSEP
jgi:hypothetical protein